MPEGIADDAPRGKAPDLTLLDSMAEPGVFPAPPPVV